MLNFELDSDREERIEMEIIVDAYTSEEQAMGWYCYLQDNLDFPFRATCISNKATSPLKVGDIVEVIGMADSDECDHEMFVEIDYHGDHLAIPLIQLESIDSDDYTLQTIYDWHYWVNQGYDFDS